jgi:hypothetical protein
MISAERLCTCVLAALVIASMACWSQSSYTSTPTHDPSRTVFGQHLESTEHFGSNKIERELRSHGPIYLTALMQDKFSVFDQRNNQMSLACGPVAHTLLKNIGRDFADLDRDPPVCRIIDHGNAFCRQRDNVSVTIANSEPTRLISVMILTGSHIELIPSSCMNTKLESG